MLLIYTYILIIYTYNNAFQINLGDSNCKSNKIWVDKGSEFYNRSMKS